MDCDCEVDLCCFFEDSLPLQHESSKDDLQKDGKCKKDQVQGTLVSIKPSILCFPYNDPKSHKQRVAIRNRTNTALKASVKSPDPNLFSVKLEGTVGTQLLIHGLAASTFTVRCIPGHYKILTKHLEVFVYTSRDKCECLRIPVEIYPSASWFKLPKMIVMPMVVIGQRANAVITLPEPDHSERFFVSFHPSESRDLIKLSPKYGAIGGKNGITQLMVSYTPMEYTTVSCSIKIHFPGLSTEPFEITVMARCKPGVEADGIREEIAEIETFRPKPQRVKRRYPKMRFRQLMEPDIIDQTKMELEAEFKKGLDLFTNAGVTRFLLKKNNDKHAEENEEKHKRKTALELLTVHVELDPREKLEIYNNMRKRLGFEFEVHKGPSYAAKIGQLRVKNKQRKAWNEFQRTVGVALLGKVQSLAAMPEDLKRLSASTPPRHSVVKKAPPVRASVKKKSSVIGDEIKKMKKYMAPQDLTAKQKFIQLALILITRMRVDKRLIKVKKLVEEIKRKKEAELDNSSNKSGSTSGKRRMSLTKRRMSVKRSVQVLYEKRSSRESKILQNEKSKQASSVGKPPSHMDMIEHDNDHDHHERQSHGLEVEKDKTPGTKRSKNLKEPRRTITMSRDWKPAA